MAINYETTSTVKNIGDDNPDGTIMGINANDSIAFYGNTPIVQPTSTTYATLASGGATTALYANSTTTGGVGSTAYTFGDLVTCLKKLGLIKQ
jgi:hypothetical protein